MAALGAALGYSAGWLVGLGPALAVVAAINGWLGGWRCTYRWTSPAGWAAFVLDSTWAGITTAGAAVAHAVAFVQRRRGGYLAGISARRNRHVYARGLTVRRGFLVTIGNVVNGAGGDADRVRRVVDEHEQVHVWQARWFGPLFPVLYGAWMLTGALAAVVSWFVGRRGRLLRRVDAWAYYRNPFEWWAYSREGRWPPPRADATAVWRRPLTPARVTWREPAAR